MAKRTYRKTRQASCTAPRRPMIVRLAPEDMNEVYRLRYDVTELKEGLDALDRIEADIAQLRTQGKAALECFKWLNVALVTLVLILLVLVCMK